MQDQTNYLYEPLPVSILVKPLRKRTAIIRFWIFGTAVGILLEWLVHKVWLFDLAINFLDLPLTLPLFPSFLVAVFFTLTVGLSWGLISFGISSIFLSYYLHLNWLQIPLFAIPFLLALALFSLCYQTISINYKLTSLPSIVFYIFVSFLAATWASLAAVIWAWGFKLEAMVLAWESWWIAIFFQTMLGSGLLIILSRKLTQKVKSGLELETHKWSFPGEIKVLAFVSIVFLVIISLLLLLNYFSGQALGSAPMSIYLNSIKLVHWILFLLVQVLGYLIYYITRSWVNNYRQELSKFESSIKTKHMNLAKVDLELQKTNNELRTFLYRASHDIQGPLASILGLAELAQLQIKDPESLELFSRVKISSGKLQKKILELIEVAELKEDQLQPQEIDFDHLMAHILDNLDLVEGASQVEVVVSNNNLLPFHSDNSLIRSILQNLLINSIGYRHKKEATSWVKVEIHDAEPSIKVIVTDNGIGIEKKHKHRVFDMFYRATESSTGSGLGLYMVKNAVRKLNGKVTLVSEEGKGTRVVLLLPPLV